LNLALDTTYSLGSDLSGVGVYSRELLLALAQAHPEQQFQWHYRPHRFFKSFRESLPQNATRRLLLDSFGPRNGLFHGLNQRLPISRFKKQIATFHDLFVMTAEYSTPEFRARFTEQARRAAGEADRIIAVSQFTANQVHELFGIPHDRIRVIHHGIQPLPIYPRPYERAPEKIILHVGAIQQRKNIARLVRAFAAVSTDWRLVLAGSAGYGAAEILAEIETNPRITVTGYISNHELAHYYSRASIFAFPSLDEGFGMPVLEAMRAGVAVIASNHSAVPEVCGDAALLIDPLDEDALACALTNLTMDAENRARLVALGQARAAQFSWQRAAEETWSVYQELTSLPRQQFSKL
jgi:glycosyltransferase involved in cell wall biosynthesis